jgi:hypothetical protein
MESKIHIDNAHGGYSITTDISGAELSAINHHIRDEISNAVIKILADKLVDNLLPSVLEKMNLKAIANIATIEAGKRIGRETLDNHKKV